ncbi:PepSY domain-containing protein [uncultured Psychrobacter sp.]|uniref:PepSY domain-containing protein n=1 Tax=uncultured Psychrobacter sp. TaxID=259303 RepID=UPI0026147234|nr:PepSY domain-containing protein [uncultured Psychrobacter sp.]
MKKTLKNFKLTTLGACLTVALTTGALSTAVVAANNSDEVSVAQAAKVSLKQAVATASKEASGTLISAELDDNDSDAQKGNSVYELEFSNDTTSYEIKVDAMTGEIVTSETEQLDKEDINDYQVQQQAKIKMTDAIDIAEKQTDGRTIEIEFEIDEDKMDHPTYYEVKVFKDNQIFELNIDAETGTVFENSIDDIDATPDMTAVEL